MKRTAVVAIVILAVLATVCALALYASVPHVVRPDPAQARCIQWVIANHPENPNPPKICKQMKAHDPKTFMEVYG